MINNIFIITITVLMVLGLTGLSAQEKIHPVTKTASYDHYPHFGGSYYFGSLDRIQKLQSESFKQYGTNKGRTIGTVAGLIAGALIEDHESHKGLHRSQYRTQYRAMAIGGLAGGLIGQQMGSDGPLYLWDKSKTPALDLTSETSSTLSSWTAQDIENLKKILADQSATAATIIPMPATKKPAE